MERNFLSTVLYYRLVVARPYVGMVQNKMAAPIHVLVFTINVRVYKYAEQLIEPAPVCSSNSNM